MGREKGYFGAGALELMPNNRKKGMETVFVIGIGMEKWYWHRYR
jgi:hypothetical protein